MFFDLNVPLPTPGAQLPPTSQTNKKGKKQQQQQHLPQRNTAEGDTSPLVFTPAQIAAIEARIDLLVHLGYTVFALNQVAQTRVDAKTHVNWLQGLVPKLKKRHGIAFLKRLTVVLDDESDKGNGINPQNASILAPYDILSLRPTTQATFSAACLSHSMPSPHTAHIISIPATLPRLPFYLKHTLVRTALKNGAAFELDYAGAVGVEGERQSWWAGAREVVRVTKGKGVLVSGGAEGLSQLRAPRDAANLITLMGIPQNLSHDALTVTPKALVLRAQSRKTYRSTLSEPKLIFPSSTGTKTPDNLPEGQPPHTESAPPPSIEVGSGPSNAAGGPSQPAPEASTADKPPGRAEASTTLPTVTQNQGVAVPRNQGKKRQRDEAQQQQSGEGRKKQKKKKS